jgi:hypothetical protein
MKWWSLSHCQFGGATQQYIQHFIGGTKDFRMRWSWYGTICGSRSPVPCRRKSLLAVPRVRLGHSQRAAARGKLTFRQRQHAIQLFKLGKEIVGSVGKRRAIECAFLVKSRINEGPIHLGPWHGERKLAC